MIRLLSRFADWLRAGFVADDPDPQYSRLDRMDGLGGKEQE